MRRACRATLALATCTLVAGASAVGAHGATRTATLSGWAAQTAAFSGRALLVSETAPVRVDPAAIPGAPAGQGAFTYYRAEVHRVALNTARTRFVGAPTAVISVRTSIGAMTPGVLTPAGAGHFVSAPVTARFPTPVTWCCTDGVQVVTESRSEPDAPRVLAAAADPGGRVRMLLAGPAGTVLAGVDPVGLGVDRTDAPVAVATTPALAAMAPGSLAWVDPAAPRTLRLAAVGDAGLGPVRAVALPGRAVRVWASAGTAVAAVRVGAGVRVVRVDGTATRARTVWNGRRVPPLGVGAGTVALADGRRILAARRGRAARPVARATGAVSAVAADGTRVAWLARGLRATSRVTVARVAAVRR